MRIRERVIFEYIRDVGYTNQTGWTSIVVKNRNSWAFGSLSKRDCVGCLIGCIDYDGEILIEKLVKSQPIHDFIATTGEDEDYEWIKLPKKMADLIVLALYPKGIGK